MIYPDNFEIKIGFSEIRRLLKERCLSTLGKEEVDRISFSTKADEVNEWLAQVRDFRRIQEETENFPLSYFYDVRASVLRARVENTFLEEHELFDLRRSLDTIAQIVKFLNTNVDGDD
jgi:DNA mismatch repair protein MutS2